MNSPVSNQQLKKNRLQLIAILSIVLIPVIGSTVMYYTGIGMPQETKNNGVLIEPAVEIADVAMQQDGGVEWSWGDSGKFRLVILLDGQCDEVCADMLLNIRQVHVRLAKRSTSLQRLLVQFDDNVVETDIVGADAPLKELFPQLVTLRSDFYEWRERLQANDAFLTDFKGHQVLLVDRRGNLIMAFNQNHSGQEMLDDVNFLIKSTQ